MYVQIGWHSSEGVKREISFATRNHIPIVWERDADMRIFQKLMTKLNSSTYAVLIRKMHALLSELNLTGQKAAMLEGYGVEHASDLSVEQLIELVDRLVQYRDGVNAAVRAMRSQVLAQLQRIGVYTDNRDWYRVNTYLEQPRIAGKRLYEMSIVELEALSSKLRAIERKTDIKRVETERLKRNN
jgi:hypothetical protein